MAKSSVVLFCFNLNSQLFDLLMGDTENPDFHDFWILGSLRTLICGFESAELLLKI